MIVNGTDQMNGADRARATAAIARSVEAPARATIALGVAADSGVTVRWRVDGAPDDARVVVVLVDREATTKVRAGENNGKTLVHANVVRAMATGSPSEDGARLDVPSDVDRAHAEIVAWVQRGGSGVRPILAATRAAFPSGR